MTKCYIGIDNGSTGSISIINGNNIIHFKTPIKKELSYTKKKQYISRVDYIGLTMLMAKNIKREHVFCLIERPMINPMRWKASLSAIRALEATLIYLEEQGIPYQYCDSKQWQKMFLPSSTAGRKMQPGVLKKAAVDVAKRLFPSVKTKDADSILIAEYARRTKL